MSPPVEPAGHESGFSLIETIVSVTLLVVVMALAMKVWDHSLQMIASSEQAMGDSSLLPLVAELRKDLHAAHSVAAASQEWTDKPLILSSRESGQVHYLLDGDLIYRNQLGPDGQVVCRRRLAFKVTGWSWRMAESSLVEIMVEVAAHEEPWLAAQRQSPQARARTVDRSTVLKIALRGLDGGYSW